ncbi:MAG TPA: Holliday junction resolvase RuvX [Candidatus Saccharimonadales bacterium]|nr:Holliday junction resolvase RuvX [Candidatus Saccharimonadales bacterium]
MNQATNHILALDVGEKRIGVARADTVTRFPFPLTTVTVDDMVVVRLREIINEVAPLCLVIGYPRNQAGQPTRQTAAVEAFAEKLKSFNLPIVWQDESLTSVLAEEYLKSHKKNYTKADIDAHAAAIILGDYLEANYA